MRYILSFQAAIGFAMLASTAIAEENVVVFQNNNQVSLVDVDSVNKKPKGNITFTSITLRSKKSMIGLPRDNPKVLILYAASTEEIDCKRQRIRTIQMSAYGPDDVEIFSKKFDDNKTEWLDASQGNIAGRSVFEFICRPDKLDQQFKSFGKLPLKDVVRSVYADPWP